MKKTPKYRRMTWEDRLRLEALYNAGHTYRFISAQLGFSSGALHAEVQHGLYNHLDGATWLQYRRYSASIAQEYADFQATAKGATIKLGRRYDYAQYVSDMIHVGWSPDVIVGRLKRFGKWTVSTTTLYRYIDQGYIPNVTNSDLLEKSRRKKHSYRKVKKAARASKGTSIERRDPIVDTRTTFGNWELDSVVGKAKGKKQSVLAFTERKTRYEFVFRVADKTSASTVQTLDRTLSKFPQRCFETITVDNGSEFQNFDRMEHDRKGRKRTSVYYCHAYCSSERAGNECANRIIRRFFPKGKTFENYTSKDCQKVQDFMNNLPRRILNYATPAELFEEELKNL